MCRLQRILSRWCVSHLSFDAVRQSLLLRWLDHEQLELFPKRAFRCDCPTTNIPVPCTLHKPILGTAKEPPNEDNVYGPNFSGRFCRCGRDYDPLTETETMVQCVACEVSLHSLRPSLDLNLLHRIGGTKPA